MRKQMDRAQKAVVAGVFVVGFALSCDKGYADYSTSFESPTFTVGQRPNQDGWSDHSTYDMLVTDSTASDGSQSVALAYRGSGTTDIFSRSFGGVNNYMQFDFNPTIFSGNKQSLWFYALTDQGHAKVQYQLFFEPTAVHNPAVVKKVEFRGDGGVEDSQTYDSTFWRANQWNTLRVEMDFVTQTADLLVNGNLIVSDLALNEDIGVGEGPAASLAGVWLIPRDGGTVLIDNVQVGQQVIPEPATLGLLGMGAVFVLSRRRK